MAFSVCSVFSVFNLFGSGLPGLGFSNLNKPPQHLVFISYYFPPMGGGGVQRITKFLKFLDYQTCRVTVLTVKPSFFYSADETLGNDIPGGVQVIRSGSLDPFRLIYLFRKLFRSAKTPAETPRESGENIRKLASAIFLPDSRLLWFPFALWKLWRLHRSRPIDAIIASMPPFTCGLIAVFRRSFAQRTILDFRDAWSDNPYLPETRSWRRRISEKMEAWCMSRAGAAVFVNPYLEAYYREKYPSLRHKALATIRNGYDPDDFPPAAIEQTPQRPVSKPFEMGIMGTIYSRGNWPESLLFAIKALGTENADFANRFRLTFLGKWSPDFLRLVETLEIADLIEFIPYLPITGRWRGRRGLRRSPCQLIRN
jgi:glycosyltransferase involved in cell wall biosynthesis